MKFIKLSETSQIENNTDKNIAIITNKYIKIDNLYDNIFILQLFDKFNNENFSIPLDYLGKNFIETLNFFIINGKEINEFEVHTLSQPLFDLIIIHHTIFDSDFFDLNIFESIIKFSKENNIKLILDIENNLELINSFYDEKTSYLFRTLVQTVDLITTSNQNLKSELINFNESIILLPAISNVGINMETFNLFKKWIILLKSLLNNELIMDVIIEYMTESVDYDIIYNNNNNDYKISIIIPVYNTGEKLRRTLKSIEYQTIGIEYLEVLMINDCSNDKATLNILKEYSKKDNFKWIDLKENQGHSGIPRNIGIKESSAEYLMFLDHDDFFEVNALEKLYSNITINEPSESDIVFGTYSTVQNEISNIYFDNNDKNGYINDLSESPRLITYPPPSIWTKIFKKELIVKNNILFPHTLGEDAIFMVKAFIYARGIKYLQRTLITFHDLGKQSITNNVTLKYLREGVLSEKYLKDYFESINKLDYFKYRVDVLANFYLKRLINANLTENEIRLIFPKYLWAMNQIKIFGSELLWNKGLYETIISNDLEKLINIKLPKLNKQTILYITVLDENKRFPLIDSLEKLLNKINIYAITYTDLKIKLWSCNLNEFTILKEIEFNDRITNFHQITNFYEDIFDTLKIDKVFFRHFGSYDYMFYFRSMIHTQKITPLSIASDRNIVTIYGENSKSLLNNLEFDYLNTTNLNDHYEKGVVYTAIFGDYEPLLDPKIINENLDYICFTDNPNITSDIWNIKIIPEFIDNFDFKDDSGNKISFKDLDYTRQARAIKSLPHMFLKEYDFSMWVDAGFLIVGDIISFVNRYTKKDFLGVTHSVRHCIYDEANEVLRLNIDDNERILKQIKKYENDNYPKNNGLIESGLLFRRHNNPKIIKVMEDWFNEILNFSKRDQISFNYVAWKNNLDFDLANMYCTRNPYFHHYFHRIKYIINNKVLLNEVRIILIDNKNIDLLKNSINEINKINDYIPITILTNNKNTPKIFEKNSYNLEIIYTENNLSSELIKNIVSKKSEKFIHIMNSGETLDYNLIINKI